MVGQQATHGDILLASEQTIVKEVNTILDAFGQHPGHIFNLGHGILPNTEPDKVSIMIEAVHTYKV